jgi:hypothetical protein
MATRPWPRRIHSSETSRPRIHLRILPTLLDSSRSGPAKLPIATPRPGNDLTPVAMRSKFPMQRADEQGPSSPARPPPATWLSNRITRAPCRSASADNEPRYTPWRLLLAIYGQWLAHWVQLVLRILPSFLCSIFVLFRTVHGQNGLSLAQDDGQPSP